jgi:hypothetical protein
MGWERLILAEFRVSRPVRKKWSGRSAGSTKDTSPKGCVDTYYTSIWAVGPRGGVEKGFSPSFIEGG